MKRIIIGVGAALLAAVPATIGLVGNTSFAQSVPVRVPSQVTSTTAPGQPASTSEPGDDKGGLRNTPTTTPGDDKGGLRNTPTTTPGDDKGGLRNTPTTTTPVDNSGNGTQSGRKGGRDDGPGHT